MLQSVVDIVNYIFDYLLGQRAHRLCSNLNYNLTNLTSVVLSLVICMFLPPTKEEQINTQTDTCIL